MADSIRIKQQNGGANPLTAGKTSNSEENSEENYNYNNTMKKIILFLLCSVLLNACKADYPGKMDDPSAEVSVVSFSRLDTTISVAKGYYDLSAYVRGNDSVLLVVQANGMRSSVLLAKDVWHVVNIRGIDAGSGEVAISGEALDGGSAVALSDVSVRSVNLTAGSKRVFIKGGDMSMLTQVEKNKGVYRDAEGKAGDCFALCAANGMNLARLRLYNAPGGEQFPGNQLWNDVQTEDAILALARRAKEAGMAIELTFHYSDYWTNGSEQYKPAAWQSYDMAQLKEAVYTYTRDFLNKMNAQGTGPEYVSLGNEIQSGILFGNADKPDSIGGYVNDMQALAALLNEGSRAVREACPEARIILHLTTSSTINLGTYKWFLSNMKNYNCDYDIIGASYYPFYGNYTIETIMDWAKTLTEMYDKDFIVMETGFAWTEKQPDGSDGQIKDNTPYGISEEAQWSFLQGLTEAIKAGSPRVLGYIYWDPIYIDAPNCGWKKDGQNVTANSALFDYEGKVLPAVNAMKYN